MTATLVRDLLVLLSICLAIAGSVDLYRRRKT